MVNLLFLIRFNLKKFNSNFVILPLTTTMIFGHELHYLNLKIVGLCCYEISESNNSINIDFSIIFVSNNSSTSKPTSKPSQLLALVFIFSHKRSP